MLFFELLNKKIMQESELSARFNRNPKKPNPIQAAQKSLGIFPISYRRCVTTTINSINGSVSINLQQPGNLYRLMGIAIVPSTASATTANDTANTNISLVINSDSVLERVSGTVLNPQTSGANQEYTPLFRKVSGNDQLVLTVQDTKVSQYDIMVYFDNPIQGT